MSTKIYDAYIIDGCDVSTINDFVKDIKKAYYKHVYNDFVRLCASAVLYMLEELPYNIAISNQERADAIVKEYGNDKTIKSLLYGKPADFESAANNIKKNSVISLVVRHAQNKLEIDDLDDYCFSKTKASIAIYTHPDGEKTMIMCFGGKFTDFMCKLANQLYEDNEEYDAIISKYNLKDYHYQNQTDMPDEIDESEWDERASAWDKVMPTGVPRKDTSIISVYDADYFGDDFTEQSMFHQDPGSHYYDRIVKDTIKYINDKRNDRLDKKAYDKAIESQIMSDPRYTNKGDVTGSEEMRIINTITREFKDKFKNNDADVIAAINKIKEEYAKHIITFDDAMINKLKSENVFQFIDCECYNNLK